MVHGWKFATAWRISSHEHLIMVLRKPKDPATAHHCRIQESNGHYHFGLLLQRWSNPPSNLL